MMISVKSIDKEQCPNKRRPALFVSFSILIRYLVNKHTIVVTSLGRLFTFGDGPCGQLGHGDRNGGDVPVEVGAARSRGVRIVFAAAGSSHSGVVTCQGHVWTWGRGAFGRLGIDVEDQGHSDER